ncbi:MAG: glycosyltransferase involved in cell wall biosynthesis [Alphaproteobacteria bacterium]|jgi:glycosyltransferase involved in cell wall biosynthesis
MKLPISVFIITKNEEKHISKTLSSVADMDEIIVVDSGSTDRTVEIASEFGAMTYFHEWQGYAKQKQYAMNLCKNEWVLNLDGDEAITPDILAAFSLIVEQDTADSVRFWRNDLFVGEPLSTLSKKPNNHRLYKRAKAYFDDSRLAHESATVDGKEVFIKLAFDHYGYDAIDTITAKNNLYSSLKAQEKYDKGKSYSTGKLTFVFFLTFIKEYFLQRKIFSGRRGFILSIMAAYYSFIKEAKLYELHENFNRQDPD